VGMKPTMEMRAFHSSPHKFDKFDADKIGTGEGVQAYGSGIYFSKKPDTGHYKNLVPADGGSVLVNGKPVSKTTDPAIKVASQEFEALGGDYDTALKNLESRAKWEGGVDQEAYDWLKNNKENITRQQGTDYEVDIPDAVAKDFLNYSKGLDEQPEIVRSVAREWFGDKEPDGYFKNTDGTIDENAIGGKEFYDELSRSLGGDEKASQWLSERGIKGSKYTGGQGDANMVVYDDSVIKMVSRDGEDIIDQSMLPDVGTQKTGDDLLDEILGGEEMPAKTPEPTAPSKGLTVKGVHFSPKKGLTELDPSYHGTGAKGAERSYTERMDEDLQPTFFYIDEGKGVAPENIVNTRGVNRYETELKKMYDTKADPDGLMAQAKAENINPSGGVMMGYAMPAFYRKVKEAGYKGFIGDSAFDDQGVGAVFDKTSVNEIIKQVPDKIKTMDLKGLVDVDDPVKGKRAIEKAFTDSGIEPPADMVRSMTPDKALTTRKIADAWNNRMALLDEGGNRTKVRDMDYNEMVQYGNKHGVDLRLSNVETVVDEGTGKSWDIAGGLEKPMTITDAYWLKSQAYDPNEMSEAFQTKLQNKLTSATTPRDMNDEVDRFNRVMFGMQSPNTPLLTNQFMTNRMRVRNNKDIDRLANMIPWEAGEKVPMAQRREFDRKIGEEFGIQSASKGGMGMRSSADLTNVAEFAKLYQKHPDFFKRRPDEPWQDFAERLIAVQRGLAPKTGSFGAVWEDPAEATTSAMDRHMARKFRPVIMDDAVLGAKTRTQRVKLWNDQLKKVNALKRKKNKTKKEKDMLKTMPPEGSKRVKDYDEIIAQTGGDNWDLAQVVTDSTKHKNPKYRLANGEINPAVPEHLRDLPIEPENVTVFGDIYRKMLGENERLAQEKGLNVFAEQWRLWDRIREQLEPHEAMHKDVKKLPKMSATELMDAMTEQKSGGFHTSGGAKPFDYRKGMAWGVGGLTGIQSLVEDESQEYD